MPRKAKRESEDDLGLDLDLDIDLDLDASDENGFDPLATVVYSGDIEADSKAEMKTLKESFEGSDSARQFRNARKQHADRTDSEYWFCVCFQSREQKEEFLRKAGLFEHGDKYLNGEFVADKLGIPVTPYKVSGVQVKIDPKLAKLAR